MCFEGEQPDLSRPRIFEDRETVERHPVAAQQQFYLAGAQMVIERLRLQGDRSFGLSQRIPTSALIRQKNRVTADDLRVVGVFLKQTLELRGGLVGFARAAELDGEDAPRLPELSVQLDRALQAAPALVELAHFEQEAAKIEPPKRQCVVEFGRATCEFHGSMAINGLAAQVGIGQKI